MASFMALWGCLPSSLSSAGGGCAQLPYFPYRGIFWLLAASTGPTSCSKLRSSLSFLCWLFLFASWRSRHCCWVLLRSNWRLLRPFTQCHHLTLLLGGDFRANYWQFNFAESEAFIGGVQPLLRPLGCVVPLGTSYGST